jgi:predicted O-methyltransferase YrrM
MIPNDIATFTSREEAQALQDICANKVCLEVGAFEGFTTVVMARVAKLVVSIDTHKGDAATQSHVGRKDTLDAYVRNLTRYHVLHKTAILVGDTDEVLPRLEGFKFDVAFIDAEHTYESCKKDTDNCLSLLKSKGLIAFHDYTEDRKTDEEFGVTQVIHEAMKYDFLQRISLTGTMLICRRLA